MTNRNLKYISFFRWIFFSYIVVFHIQFFISGSYILYFTQVRFDHVHLMTDCFFVISGFLLSKYFNQSKSKSILSYTYKRFLDLFPICLLFWICFALFSPISKIEVDLIAGFKDIFGLNVFGTPWYHNYMNFTWFSYSLFWVNVLFFILLKFKKIFFPVAYFLVLFAGYTVIQYFNPKANITGQPYDFIFLNQGTFRAIFACGLGLLSGIYANRYRQIITNKDKEFFIFSCIEILPLSLFIIIMKFLSSIEIYIIGLILFSISLFSLSLNNSLLNKLINRDIFHYGEKYLLNAYIFSSIALLSIEQLTKLYPKLIETGDFLIFVCLALSVVFGRVIFFITNNIKRQALKIPNCFKRIY